MGAILDSRILLAACLVVACGCSGEEANCEESDNECPSTEDSALADADGDGYAAEEQGGQDCDDENAAINPAATDLVGDGYDQNCDGVDGTDADGDGYASELTGGYDCDDEDPDLNPGAWDELGDELDQDCDGIDGEDEDGDGHASEDSGGDDCDDGDPDVNPGATDVVNKVDDDCNGWADERIVCPDGSAEFLTIQEAADAAADGTTILLCEGEYEGGIVLKGRQLSIRGNTSDPSAVTVGAGSGRALDIDGGAVEISWLSLTTETAQVIASASNGRLSMDTVRFVASETWQSLELGSMSSVEISRSYFEPGSYVDGDGIASLVMTYNIFDGAGVGSFSDGDLEIHHNLVVGSSWLSLDGSESDINCSFYNNTVADLDEWSIYLTWYSYPDFPQVRVFDNIFAFIDSGTLYSVRWVCYSICSYDISDVAPQRFSDNVIFQVPEPLSNVTYYWYSGGHYEGYITDDSLSEDIEYDNIFADPDFEHNFKGERSYTLSSDSIAAGKGAIGGDEEGNWWNEVPWDLPESGVWL